MAESRVFFTHQTASQYWVHRNTYEAPRTDCVPARKDAPSKLLLEDVAHLVIGQSGPLHVSVTDKANFRSIDGARLHTRSVPYPSKSFCRIARGVYVACPELCFLQAAQTLSFAQLAMYGLELCGTFARTSAEFQTRYKRDSLTNARKIRAYLEKSTGALGVKTALLASNYLLDGSASPREAELVLIECLPPLRGGFGVALPKLNYGIKVNAPDSRNPGQRLVLHGDIVWPEAKLVVEYDGEQHGLVDNHSSDKQRDHLLLDAGYQVVRFTDERMRQPEELRRLAMTVVKRSGKRHRKSSFELDERKIALQQELLFESNLPWLE